MIAYSLFLSLLATIVFPILSLIFFPEVWSGKGVRELPGWQSVVYIAALSSFLYYIFYTRKDVETSLFHSQRESFTALNNASIGMLFILILYIGRLLYYLYVHASPYELLVQHGSQIVDSVGGQIVNYYYIFTNFKLYPLVQAIIVLSLPKKYWPIFFSTEIAYSLLIYSKYLLFSTILLMMVVYFPRRTKLSHVLISIVALTVVFFLVRELFGHLRFGGGPIELAGIGEMIASGISRIQAVFPIFYAEYVLDDWLYGKSLCRVIGLLTPDSLIALPQYCQNIDEDKMLFYLGVTELRVIDKDLLNFWSEPFANFGIFGVFLIYYTVVLVEKFSLILRDSNLSVVFSWVVLTNSLMPHSSWSAFIGIICISFVVIWLLSRVWCGEEVQHHSPKGQQPL